MPGMSSMAGVRPSGGWTVRRGVGTALLIAVLWLTTLPLAIAGTAARDPAEGLWWGTVGSAREKVEVGLNIARGADGKLTLRLTQPISNNFDIDPGGELKRVGDRVVNEDLALSLQLQGDRLSGTYPGPNSPATFTRTKRLPVEQPPPALPQGPAPRWETRLSGQVYASPVVAEGVAYIGTTGGVVNAIDTRDGKSLWTFTTGAPIFGSVAVTADAIYVVADTGFLYRLDRRDGKQR